jgi:hypothetical protein
MTKQKIYISIQQWMADKGVISPSKELKALLFGLWRDKEVEVNYWRELYKRTEKSYQKTRSDLKRITKRKASMEKTRIKKIKEGFNND